MPWPPLHVRLGRPGRASEQISAAPALVEAGCRVVLEAYPETFTARPWLRGRRVLVEGAMLDDAQPAPMLGM